MRWPSLVALVALAACRGEEPGRAGAEAPRAEAPRSPSFVSLLPPADPHTLRFRLSAPAAHPLHLENCNGAFSWGVERRVAGAWKPAWIAEIDACHSAPIVLQPGESRDFREGIPPGAATVLQPDSYRIAVYGLYSRHDDADHPPDAEVPGELRVSQPFLLGAPATR